MLTTSSITYYLYVVPDFFLSHTCIHNIMVPSVFVGVTHLFEHGRTAFPEFGLFYEKIHALHCKTQVRLI